MLAKPGQPQCFIVEDINLNIDYVTSGQNLLAASCMKMEDIKANTASNVCTSV